MTGTTPARRPRTVRRFSLGLLAAAFIALFTVATATAGTTNLRVLQMNTWLSGAQVKDGEKLLADQIQRAQPDVVILAEAQTATQNVTKRLNQNGTQYYSTPPSGKMNRPGFPAGGLRVGG